MTFKPMLACSKVPDIHKDIKYPVLASVKLDGIRCLIRDGLAVSRTLKPIPNKFVQRQLAGLPEGFDGELVLRGPDGLDFNKNQSAIMSQNGEPDFLFYVFDALGPNDRLLNAKFCNRLDARLIELSIKHKRVQLHHHYEVSNAEGLQQLWDNAIASGQEGLIVRDPNGPYKCGRSTMNQGWMLKLKTWFDEEFEITGAEELMHNENPEETDKLGHTVRSSHQANQVPGGTLGSLRLRLPNGKELGVGSGFDDAERARLWALHLAGKLVGQRATIKHLGLSAYGVPRHPIYKAIRDPRDLG